MFGGRELRRKIRMDLCDGFPPLPQLRTVLDRDVGETSVKNLQRLFPGSLRRISQRCLSGCRRMTHPEQQIETGVFLHARILGQLTQLFQRRIAEGV